MRNKIIIRWLLLVVVLASVAFLSSCSQEITGGGPAPSTPFETSATPAVETPDFQISDYRLAVDGLVDNPLSLTYDAIMQYPAVSDNPWLICPGVFETQNEWTGVPVKTLLDEAGIKAEATKVKFSSSDNYIKELSIEAATAEGVFLAYKCDGQTLSESDGYPLRIVAKDQLGDVWVKRLAHIEVK